MKVTLSPGQFVQVDFVGTDGQFDIHFDTKDYPKSIAVEEASGCTANTVGQTGLLYHDKFEFGNDDDADDVREHSSEVDVGESSDESPVGFFMDAQGSIHCTAMVRCAVVDESFHSKSDLGPTWVVETLSSENEVTGSFTFYRTLEELENASGSMFDRKIIA